MPPSTIDIYEQRLKLEVLCLLDLVDRVMAEKGAAHCSFTVDGFECKNAEETFCGRCEMGLCSCHVQVFGCEPYCPNCARQVRAEMLPIIHAKPATGRTASEYGNDEIRWPDGLQKY